jgi:hypothetical protein
LDARVAFPPETSPDELERQANRVRSEIGATVDQLRMRLTPRNIAAEIAEGSGLRDLTPRSFVDFAARRHPVSTVLAGLGLGVLAFTVLRSSEKSGPGGALRDTLGALTQSARNSFQSHAAAKREDFIRAAEAQLSAGAEHVSDAIEKGVGELVSRVPAPSEARPLIGSALQVLLIAALEAILAKAKK